MMCFHRIYAARVLLMPCCHMWCLFVLFSHRRCIFFVYDIRMLYLHLLLNVINRARFVIDGARLIMLYFHVTYLNIPKSLVEIESLGIQQFSISHRPSRYSTVSSLCLLAILRLNLSLINLYLFIIILAHDIVKHVIGKL